MSDSRGRVKVLEMLSYRVFFLLGLPSKVLSTEKLIYARLGVSRTIYVNVDSPNLGFTYFNFLGGGGGQLKKSPCMLSAIQIYFQQQNYIVSNTNFLYSSTNILFSHSLSVLAFNVVRSKKMVLYWGHICCR